VSQHHKKHQRRRVLAAALVFVALGLFAAAGAVALVHHRTATASIDSAAQTERLLPTATGESVPGAASSASVTGERTDMPRPTRVEVPAIGVSARVVPLGLNPDGTIEVPQNYDDTGWFTDAAEPGERGAAVILGHVDSKSGPAVFFHLRALRRGDAIEITLKDGSKVRYVVTSSLEVAKARFPTKRVYTPTRRPTLRLITCGGEFDSATGHYLDNYIVFAKIADA
jgi:sortase (surface protein transpeptidase)